MARTRFGSLLIDTGNVKDHMLSTNHLIKFSHQINRCTEYPGPRITIHQHLAVWNISDADNEVMKISGFGLAKQGEAVYTVLNFLIPLPILWMLPEAILRREFSQKSESDIWSFGTLLYETFSMGHMPSEELDMTKFSANTFVHWLIKGNQMIRPDSAPLPDYKTMHKCLNLTRKERSNFADLQKSLDNLVHSSIAEVSFYLTLKTEKATSQFTEAHKEIQDYFTKASRTENC